MPKNDKFVRLYAEFDNYRRRTNKERIDLIGSASAGVIKDMIPVLDDLERTINDGINTVKTMTKDRRLLPGAGATDIALAQRLKKFAATKTGLEQYAIRKFGEALEVCPRTLGENGGQDYAELLSALYSAHAGGNPNIGVDIENDGVIDCLKNGIFDPFAVKENALVMASDAVITVLRVDQIIMSKQAGGPKKR